MAQMRVVFGGPQRFASVTVSEMTVEADQIVLLNGGQQVLNVRAESVRTLEGEETGGGRLARLRAKHPTHGKPWSAEEDARLRELHGQGVRRLGHSVQMLYTTYAHWFDGMEQAANAAVDAALADGDALTCENSDGGPPAGQAGADGGS